MRPMTRSYAHPFAYLKTALTKTRNTPEGAQEIPPVFLCISSKGIRGFDPGDEFVCSESDPGTCTVAIYPHATAAQVEQLGEAWGLHHRLVARLLKPTEGKHGQFHDVLYLPLRAAQYIDETGDVQLIPIQVLLRGSEMVILLPDGVWVDGEPLLDGDEPSISDLELRGAHTDLLEEMATHGPPGLTYWLVEEVVSSFVPALEGLEEDQEQIEVEVFTGKSRQSQRIYKLNQEAAELLRASNAIARGLPSLMDTLNEWYPDTAEEGSLHFGDLEQHVQSLSAQVTSLRESLSQVLTINATLVAERQNDDMKKISGWAGIAFAPTLIAGIYGMNFEGMPELGWAHGYPIALGVMVLLSGSLFIIFKKNDWI